MGILRSILPMKKIGKITVVCFVVLALFLQGKPVAFASTSTWTAQTSKSDLPINSVAYGVDSNGHGLWVTGESNGKIDTSPDGVTWTFSPSQIDPPFNDYFSSAVFGSEWVLVGQIGEIVTSPDGSTWTKRNTPANTPDLLGVAYGGGTYVAVGQSGTILRSANGTDWSSHNAGTNEFWGVAYGGGQFVAVSSNGGIYTSLDGISWISRTSGTSSNLDCVTFGGGLFIAAGDNGTIRTSPDGVTWTSRTSSSPNNLYGIAYGAGKFVVVGDSNTIVSSLDGTTWSAEQPASEPSGAYLDCVAYGGSKFVVGGGDGGEVNYPGIIQTQVYSNNADLRGLALSSGTLSPAFISSTTSYTASVPNSATSVNVMPTLADSTATVTVNGTAATGGNAVAVNLNVGSNIITVVVTASNGNTKTYTVTVTRAQSSNANLSNLTLDQGPLSPAFSSSTLSYTYDVPYSVSSVKVTPTLADSAATLMVNTTATTSGSAIVVPLSTGSTTITVVVTAQDGSTQTYTVTVTHAAPSTNANLSNLTLDHGTLSPSFASGTTSYTASVGNDVTRVDVTPTVVDSTATLKVNGNAVTSGNPETMNLNVGDNTITVLVTAQDGTTTRVYTITVTRAPSSNADLSNLIMSQGNLTPAFAVGTTDYTASVGNGVTSVDVTPTAVDSTAVVTVNGNAVTSGSPKTVNLSVADNTITVLVTAQDGTQKTYTITVTRAPSSNADLSNLTLSQGTLTPSFASGTTSYTASVANSVASVNATPTVSDTTATFTVNGKTATSGSAVNVPLNVGSNTISVVVTAQDGTTQTYVVTVTRAQSSNANLNNLTLDQGTLSPTFASGTMTYTASVANSVTSVNVTPTVTDSTATFTVNGSAATSGSAVNVPLNVGNNTITVVVTAQDGSTQTYTITVTRAQSSNADLSSLTLDQGTLSPTFASGTLTYTATVANSVSSVNVMPTVTDSTATFTVNGSAATSGIAVNVHLNVGNNTIAVVVTAQNGTTQKTYTVMVTRAASSNADLSNLTLSQGTLSPTFAPGTTSYTDSVASSVTRVNVTPTAADTTATLTVNGSAVTSGSAVNVHLNVGSNTITVVVTAQNGTKQTYTITVTRDTVIGGGNPAPGLPFVIASQTVDNTGAIIQKTNGDTSITVNVPAGAFSTPEQLTVSAGVIGDLSHILTGLPSKSVRIVLGVNFDGAAPTIPITVTITNPSITKDTVLYKVGADGHLVTVKATISDGEATLSFTSDPDFITVNLTSGERVITSAGTAAIVPSFVHIDAGINTTYMPIWYVMQLLKGMGIESTWDGHNLNMTTSRPIETGHINAGTGTTHVYVNGSLLQDVTTVAAVDPSTNKPTMYMPIWYVMQILSHLGLDSTWDGITWTLTSELQGPSSNQ